jgi:hypothetical protein
VGRVHDGPVGAFRQDDGCDRLVNRVYLHSPICYRAICILIRGACGRLARDRIPVVSFPYGIPTPGKYRVFVQMKRAGRVETGMFEIVVI